MVKSTRKAAKVGSLVRRMVREREMVGENIVRKKSGV